MQAGQLLEALDDLGQPDDAGKIRQLLREMRPTDASSSLDRHNRDALDDAPRQEPSASSLN
jgi:hypothetical protein